MAIHSCLHASCSQLTGATGRACPATSLSGKIWTQPISFASPTCRYYASTAKGFMIRAGHPMSFLPLIIFLLLLLLLLLLASPWCLLAFSLSRFLASSPVRLLANLLPSFIPSLFALESQPSILFTDMKWNPARDTSQRNFEEKFRMESPVDYQMPWLVNQRKHCPNICQVQCEANVRLRAAIYNVQILARAYIK